MLVVDNIHSYYDESHVLQGISLRVESGETVAILGRNGAGKSTVVKSIIGFQQPRTGRIYFSKVNITHLPSYRIARLGAGLVPQGQSIFPTLTVRENIMLASRGMQKGTWNLDHVLATFPNLAERLTHRGCHLSGGEQKLIAVVRALMTNPKMLILDEPSEGLAPLIIEKIGLIIRSLRDQGVSVLLVEQNLNFAIGVADHVYVMNKGRIVFHGNPEELRRDEKILQFHLGL